MRICTKHNYRVESFATCPYCQQEKHNRTVEREAKSQGDELRRQSAINLLILEQQNRLEEDQKKANQELLKIQNKTYEAHETELNNQKRFRCVGYLNQLIPSIQERYGINFLVANYLRIAYGIEIWSDNLVSRAILRDALGESLNQTTLKIINLSDELSILVEEKKYLIKNDLQIQLNKIADETNIKMKDSNIVKGIFISIATATFLVWEYFTKSVGIAFYLLSVISIVAATYAYSKIATSAVYPKSIAATEVSAHYKKFIDRIPGYVSEISEAKKIAGAMNNGELSVFPLLNKWAKTNNQRTTLLADLKLQINFIRKYNVV